MARYMPENVKPGDAVLHDMPIIETPFSRVGDQMMTSQSGPCADLELDYMKCLGRTGHKRGEKECRLFYEDWAECTFQMKQTMRYVEMQKIRKQKGIPFPPKPIRDSFETGMNV